MRGERAMVETIKVKPWGEGQGDHVVINAEDFDPEVHTALETEPKKPAKRKEKA
jgi:hypothetical protein